MNGSDSKSAADAIKAAKKILLVTHSRPTVDAITSLAVVYTMLKDHYKKSVDVALPTELSSHQLRLLEQVGLTADKIQKTLPQRTYTISIKKQGEKIESIKYDEHDDVFNFVITPFNGALDLESIAINETGANYDLIITIDTPSLNFLGDLYKENIPVFTNVPTISFDNHKSNTGYATYTLSESDVDTTSQVVLHFAEEENVSIKPAVADLLFIGIDASTGLGLKTKIRSSVYTDLGKVVVMGAQPTHAHDALYAPSSLNEIFLIGDILDSANEGTLTKQDNAKIIGCKITLNKEEVETIDLDKAAQVVFWNIKMPEIKLGYIVFQKTPQESVAYIYVYDSSVSISTPMKELNGKGDKQSGKIVFTTDMHAAEAKIKEAFGIELAQKAGKFGPNAFADDFDAGFDDFGADFGEPFGKPQAAPLFPSAGAATNPFPPVSAPPLVPTGPEQKPQESDNQPAAPARFDPRLGK